jgi:membrane-bound lytic murein transglycosylase D
VFIPTAGTNKQLNDAVTRVSKPVEQPSTRIDAKPAEAKNETMHVNGILAMKAYQNEPIATFAKRANIDLSYFLKCNDLSISDRLIPGNYYYLKKKKTSAYTYQHVAKQGDDLWSISQQYGVQLRKLKKYNNITSGNKIAEGSVVLLSSKKGATSTVQFVDVAEVNPGDTFSWSVQPESIQTSSRPVIVVSTETIVQPTVMSKVESEEISIDPAGKHIVGPGETLYSIGKRYNVGVMNLVEWNNLNLKDGLKVGQVLRISEAKGDVLPSAKPAEVKEITHEVKNSDTLYSIARQYGVTIKDLMEWNQKKDFSLAAGENLRILKK